jgi:hypothetical protein
MPPRNDLALFRSDPVADSSSSCVISGAKTSRRQINLQLNKGEALHSLRRYLFVANEAQIRKRHPEDQHNQAACLNLVTNAVVAWNTVYMWEAIEQLKKEGRQIEAADVKHLSPARYEHINVFGKYSFPVKEELSRKSLRPLRAAGQDAWEG